MNSNGQVKLTWNAGTYTPSTTTTEKPTTGHHYNPYSMHVMKPHGHHGKILGSVQFKYVLVLDAKLYSSSFMVVF